MFKSSGIVRRLDDCGRISIPNQIRRRYHLKNGDPIEIGENSYTIELRKYSPIEVFGDKTKAVIYAFADAMNLPVILCDTYKVIASKNVTPCEDKYISQTLYQCMESNEEYNLAFSIFKESEVRASAITWIRSNNIIGALIIPQTETIITEVHTKCLKVCANVIGRMVN